MNRTSSILAFVPRLIRTSASSSSLPCIRPIAIACRNFSVFSSEGPSEALSKLMKDKNFSAVNDAALDNHVPLGAPKPSVLNKLRATGRSPSGREARDNAVEEKLRKAMDYKQAKKDAAEKNSTETTKKN